jgi:sirohydrochlorin ferrochelatase
MQPGGRHRRAVPSSLPEGSPALVLAVPSIGGDVLTGPAAEIASIIGLDNPALDIRLAKADTASHADPDGIRTVLADAAAKRPAGAPSAIVVPLLASAHPATILSIRDAISASGANACISEVFNTNALLAEALHIRLADAGLARADRVRMFSITTSADGILVVTVGGPEALGMASVTSVLLAARLALPVLPASLDSQPTIEQQAMQLQAMGVTRIAIAPCVIGPEVPTGAVEEAASAVGGKCAAPLGAHGNIVKLIVAAYGQALSQLKTPEEPVGSERPRHQAGALISSRLRDAVLPGPGGDLHPVTQPELALDAGQVGLDRAQRDEKLGRDLRIGPASGDGADDVGLPV